MAYGNQPGDGNIELYRKALEQRAKVLEERDGISIKVKKATTGLTNPTRRGKEKDHLTQKGFSKNPIE